MSLQLASMALVMPSGVEVMNVTALASMLRLEMPMQRLDQLCRAACGSRPRGWTTTARDVLI